MVIKRLSVPGSKIRLLAVDCGIVYFFTRTGSTWNSGLSFSPGQFEQNAECGYSVAISNGTAVFGCPGMGSNTGRAWIFDPTTATVSTELIPAALPPGSFYGASVAIDSFRIIVGAPTSTVGGKTNAGRAFQFDLQGGTQGTLELIVPVQDGFLGAGLATSSDFGGTILIGMPGTNQVFDADNQNPLQANDSSPGDSFGQTLALSGNTAVIGAPG